MLMLFAGLVDLIHSQPISGTSVAQHEQDTHEDTQRTAFENADVHYR